MGYWRTDARLRQALTPAPLAAATLCATVYTLLLCGTRCSAEPTELAWNATVRRINLVTSHFAWDTAARGPCPPHYTEIEMALVANWANLHVDVLRVLYDTQDGARDGCDHLQERLLLTAKHAGVNLVASRHNVFKCQERSGGQPSYFDFFAFASATVPPGEVAVVGNADGVLDDSVARLRVFPPGRVNVLSVAGGKPTRAGAVADALYKKHLPMYHSTCSTMQRCFPPSKTSANCSEEVVALSWDAYAFVAPLRGLDSTRMIMLKTIFANQHMAENRAAGALLASGATKGLRCDLGMVANVCLHVRWHHFHCTAKMHNTIEASGATAAKGLDPIKSKLCTTLEECTNPL